MGDLSLSAAIWSSVKPILKIYFIIITGFILARKNILTVETSRNLSDLVVSVALPALTFSKIVTNLSYDDAKSIGLFSFICIIMLTVGGIFGIGLNYVTRNPKIFFYGLICAGVFSNIGDLPIAFIQGIPSIIFDSKMTDKGVAYVCIFSFAEQFVFFNLGFANLIGLDFRDHNAKDSGSSNNNNNENVAENNISGIEDKPKENMNITADLPTSDAQSKFQVPSRLRGFSNASNNLLHRISSVTTQNGPSQKINDMINEYSEAPYSENAIDDGSELVLARSQNRGVLDELSLVRSRTNFSKHESNNKKDIESQNEPTEDVDSTGSSTHSKIQSFAQRHHLTFFVTMLENFKRPASAAIVLGLIVALVPWFKALLYPYTNHRLHIDYHDAPDFKPPLHFIVDIATYVGNSEVPLGLLLLGATLGRLEVSNISKGLVVTSLSLAMVRLVIMPIIGALLMTKFKNLGWFNDDMAAFLAIINWGLPSMTTQIYITAFFTPIDGPHLQMDCMAIIMLTQYIFLIISFPVLTTYALKNILHY